MLFDNEKLSYRNGDSATVGIGDWLGFDLIGVLCVIPFVGAIIAIVLYIVIAATRATSPTIQNRIIADLIWCGIALLAWLLVAIAIFVGWLSIPNVRVTF